MLAKCDILQSGKRDLLTACRAQRLPWEHPVPPRAVEKPESFGAAGVLKLYLTGKATITKTQSPTRGK